MQRKALKQLGKVTQWTSEKVFSGEKTQLSQDFLDFEKDIEVRRHGIERLHATSLPFFEQLTKVKTTADPYPPPGSGKEKVAYTEALGLVMIDYGDEIGDDYGDALSKYGRARCRLASVQEEFASRLGDGYVAGMESALAAVNEYKTLRKKLDSRRLALDAVITKAQNSKKDSTVLEDEVNIAKQRFEEVEEETHSRMVNIKEAEAEQYALLTDLLEAEVDYHAKCKEILDDLRNAWGSHSSRAKAKVQGRSRSNTATSSRSLGRTIIARSHSSRHVTAPPSSEEDISANGRSRSQSNASSSGRGGTKEKRSILPSFGSLGRKSGFSSVTPKKEKRSKFDDSRTALHSEADDDDDEYEHTSYSATRDRTHSQLSSSVASMNSGSYGASPSLRRNYTSPPTPSSRHSNPNSRLVKALFDYNPNSSDELGLRVGMVIKVESEVNSDWWIGRSENGGESGMFPGAYTEDYVPTPITAVPPKRNMAPALGGNHNSSTNAMTSNVPPSPNMSLNSDFDSDVDHDDGFSDADHHFTAPLAAAPQPAANRALPAGKKAAPPPPPSRRAASSSNILDLSKSMNETYLSPPRANYGRTRSGTIGTVKGHGKHQASPFAGSEDEDY